VPKDIREAVGAYATEHGSTIAGAVTQLLSRGLHTPVADELSHQLEAIADYLATRLELAVVQYVPQDLIDVLVDGQFQTQPLYTAGSTYGGIRFGRRSNILEVEFEVDNFRLATFRFAGDHVSLPKSRT